MLLPFSNPTVFFICIAPLVLIFFDLLSGVTRAVHDRTFTFRRIADFLGTVFFRYVVAFAAVMFLWFASNSIQAVIVAGTLGMTTLSASIVASILENFSMSGLPPTVEKDLEEVTKDIGVIAEHPPANPMVDTEEVPELGITQIITAKILAWRPS